MFSYYWPIKRTVTLLWTVWLPIKIQTEIIDLHKSYTITPTYTNNLHNNHQPFSIIAEVQNMSSLMKSVQILWGKTCLA